MALSSCSTARSISASRYSAALLLQVGGNVDDFKLSTEALVFPDDRVHRHQIDNAGEIAFGPDRQLHDHGNSAQALFDHIDAAEEVRTDTVHLVDETHARNIVFVSLTPHSLGLGLNAANGVETSDGAIEHTKGTFNFNSEVNVTRGVDDVNAVILPKTGRRSRRDGNATFLFPVSIQSMVAAPSWTSPIL